MGSCTSEFVRVVARRDHRGSKLPCAYCHLDEAFFQGALGGGVPFLPAGLHYCGAFMRLSGERAYNALEAVRALIIGNLQIVLMLLLRRGV